MFYKKIPTPHFPPSRVKKLTKKEKIKPMPPSPLLLRVKVKQITKSFKKLKKRK
jgi:hypothetical protein